MDITKGRYFLQVSSRARSQKSVNSETAFEPFYITARDTLKPSDSARDQERVNHMAVGKLFCTSRHNIKLWPIRINSKMTGVQQKRLPILTPSPIEDRHVFPTDQHNHILFWQLTTVRLLYFIHYLAVTGEMNRISCSCLCLFGFIWL